MNILALDLGTKTGWALQEGGRIESGVQDFTPKRGESAGMRYVHFNRWLHQMLWADLSGGGRPLVVYEMPHLRGGAAATVLAGLQTRVEEFCAQFDLEHTSVHSATLKKFVTGSGRGDKPAMAAAAMHKGWLGRKLEACYDGKVDDNEVDALCLLHYALSELVPKA